MLGILMDLVGNAAHALDERPSRRRLVLRISRQDAGHVAVRVGDNGTGIPGENLSRIFTFGFTTKQNGHGFGLHSSANAAAELGGRLTVHSDGLGHGATFTLELPVTGEGQHTAQAPSAQPHAQTPAV